jgi:uncharacterized membrane protein YkgB
MNVLRIWHALYLLSFMKLTFIHFLAGLDGFGKKTVRFGIVVVFLWIGGLKFFTFEADSLVPFVAHSPFLFFFYSHPDEYKPHMNQEGQLIAANHEWHEGNETYVFSHVLGIVEVSLAVLLALYRVLPVPSMIANCLVVLMTCGTLSFLITTPENWVPHLGDVNWGFPYLSGRGRLIIKDIVILGGAIVTASDTAVFYLKHSYKEILVK